MILTLNRFIKHFFIALFLIGTISAFGQNAKEPCGTHIYHNLKLQQNPEYYKSVSQSENELEVWMQKNASKFKQKGENKIVIPIVFHNVYNKDSIETQKLDHAKFLEQIEILNRDFNKENLNRSQTRPIFDSIAESMEVVFTLAHTDPDGNPTNGITYTETDVVGFDLLPFSAGYVNIDSLKSTSGGGKDAWIGNYLNVWVGRITIFTTEGLLGIATFPRSAPSGEIAGNPPPEERLEGISMLPKVIGTFLDSRGDTVYSGRTLTHEVGHFLGLRHIWGDDDGNPCIGNDFVDDTPQATNNAQQECNFNLNECSNESNFWAGVNPPNNIENFMDYSGDQCYTMFTRGQVQRMTGFVNIDRTLLWDSSSVGGKDPTQFKSWVYTMPTNCPNSCDGTININTEKNTGTVRYFIDSIEVFDAVNNDLCAGVHTIMVIDNDSDTITYDAFVPQGKYIEPSYTSSSTIATCASCNDGTAKVNINGGKAPFTVTWNTSPPVTADSIINVAPGFYSFTITDACGIQTTDSVEVSFAVGIDELNIDDIKIAPNPSSNSLNILLPETKVISSISIIDLRGATIKQVNGLKPSANFSINVSDLDNGTYLIKLTDPKGNNITSRFMKI